MQIFSQREKQTQAPMGVQVEVGLAFLSSLHALYPLSQDGTIANPTHTCAGGH